jgi:EmrB/QacA subfamily drug resistance transporter
MVEYKWKAFSVTAVGSLMSAVDSTIVLLALLPIAEDLHSDYVTIVWVIVAYLLVNTSLVLSLGRLADIQGRKKMYNVGFVIFIIGSALSGVASSGLTLVAYRAVQGVGAALLTANSFAILSEAFPPGERGKAFGSNSIIWGLGSIIGIILGGVIISYTSWRLIFLINVPIGIFGTVWAYKTLVDDGHRKKKAGLSIENSSDEEGKRSDRQTFDIPAALSFTAALLFLQLGVTLGLLYSWTDGMTLLSFCLFPFLLLFFLVWEHKYSTQPIIDLRMFSANRVFSISIATAMLQSLALFSVNFLLLFYLEGIYGLSVLSASYLVVPMALTSAVVGPIAGRLSDRVGARVVASAGLAVQAAALLLLSKLSVSTPLLNIGAVEMLYGLGGGLFWPSNTSAIMSAAPKESYGAASGIMNTFRNTGMVMSFALSLTAASAVLPAGLVYSLFLGSFTGTLSHQYAVGYLKGQGFAFQLSAVLLALSVIFSLLRGKVTTRERADLVPDG